MVVQKGRLNSTDTTKNMASYYSDGVASVISDVDRGIHNGTQFVRNVLQRPQPESAAQAAVGSPDSLIDSPHLVDGSYVASPSSNVDLIRIAFDLNQLVATTEIKVYSVEPLDTTEGNWEIATSLDGTDAQFNLANFKATNLSIAEDPVILNSQAQFRYTISFTAPSIGGLRYWRVKRSTGTDLSTATEVEILSPLTPTISYFNTDGTFASSFSYEQSNILDVTYDLLNAVYYTIRFNADTVGTVTIDLGDDFSEAEAGSAVSTTNFNPSRWVENSTNAQFLRVGEQLSYSVVTGLGQLETTYVLEADHIITLLLDPESISSRNMWFAVRALDGNNNTVMSEGFGYDDTPTTTGVVFNTYISNLGNFTANSELREFRPLWHNTVIGTDQFTIDYGGSTWTVSGTSTGALADASTGVTYDEGVDSSTPFSLIISSTATPTPGEQFTFDLVTVSGHRFPLESGTVGFRREGDTYISQSVLTSGTDFTTGDVSIELFGNTDGSVNFTADDFTASGTGSFPDVAVFTIEATDSVGAVDGTPLIDAFDVIGDPSKSYNDFLDGRVQIACTSSGGVGGFVYIKIENSLYKYPNNISLGVEDGSGATISTIGQLPSDGTSSFSWTHRSGIGGLPFLTYLEFDDGLGMLHVKTLDKDTLQDTTSTKEVLLNISNYDNTINNFKVFFDQNDFDTLYYVDASTNLQAFNLDDRISSFMAVNAEDVTLPAGTAQQTLVNADVINPWGEPLAGKVVTFAVTEGDGATAPSTDTTDSEGRATTQFTVGSTVGVSTITATVTEI